ncbi:chaperonin [Psilocybe cubensis]|uniref:Chaperonin n=1 Tax=Psilocybe cubensis TaxID=181762 RepID=A0ACB8GJW0_PSICU|nr:chaperonin [Psilocybe cubensis]KAH9475740.1 chaperonin [Psilocybe cubensis]
MGLQLHRCATLGPKGHNVIIEQAYGGPKITKDKFENLGARLIQDVASKTNEIAGDGTTTATVLARAIYSEDVKNVAAGCNPMDLRRGSQAAVDRVVSFLSAHAKTITTTAEIAQVATISANGDAHVGGLIAQAMEKVGKEGVITVKEGKMIEDEIEITEGMRFDCGYISPYFITNTKSQRVEFEKPFILLSEKKISALQDILPALEAAAQASRPLIIIAEDVDGEALAACILNKLRGQLQVCAVKAPGFGDNRKSILGDLAILTGGTVFTDELDVKLERASAEMLGSTGSVTVTKDDTIILNGEGAKDQIAARCEQIRALIADPTTGDFDRSKLQERLAKLSGGVAVIKVGGASEVEVGEKKDRYDDALNTTRAAVEEGILPGGGVALLKASLQLATASAQAASTSSPVSGDAQPIRTANFDQELGVGIIRRALTQPTRPTGYGSADKLSWGYNAAKGEYVDMVREGIVDPLKVVRTALVDASGVASLLFTSEACVVNSPRRRRRVLGEGAGVAGSVGVGGNANGNGGAGGILPDPSAMFDPWQGAASISTSSPAAGPSGQCQQRPHSHPTPHHAHTHLHALNHRLSYDHASGVIMLPNNGAWLSDHSHSSDNDDNDNEVDHGVQGARANGLALSELMISEGAESEAVAAAMEAGEGVPLGLGGVGGSSSTFTSASASAGAAVGTGAGVGTSASTSGGGAAGAGIGTGAAGPGAVMGMAGLGQSIGQCLSQYGTYFHHLERWRTGSSANATAAANANAAAASSAGGAEADVMKPVDESVLLGEDALVTEEVHKQHSHAQQGYQHPILGAPHWSVGGKENVHAH